MSISNDIRELSSFKALADIERVKGCGGKAFEGRFVILTKRIEEIMDSTVNLSTGISRSRAVGLTRMGAPSERQRRSEYKK
ncbi:hypothetical protein J3454_10550 [Erythrobacter sp. NFXS35]|uniref:hypothetical protein n=1 Tax=Erythrobacter sp. NFXS35 TaxID=2818436 RepID=UPI0032DEF3F7